MLPLLFLIFVNSTHAYSIQINNYRNFLFGDVLEPLYSIEFNASSLSSEEIVKIFHQWERISSETVFKSAGNSPIDYRNAMPCFPGPDWKSDTSSDSDDYFPHFPTCERFVNLSLTLIGEVEDFLGEIGVKNDNDSTIGGESLAENLRNRVQNFLDVLPKSKIKDTYQIIKNQLNEIPAQQCDISSIFTSTTNFSSPVAVFLCENLEICNFADFETNNCTHNIEISEEIFEKIQNMTIEELLEYIQGDPLKSQQLMDWQTIPDNSQFLINDEIQENLEDILSDNSSLPNLTKNTLNQTSTLNITSIEDLASQILGK